MNYQEIAGRALFEPWAATYKQKIDADNQKILAARQSWLDARDKITRGDFVLDGDKVLRVAHDGGDAIQLTDGEFGASFYLGDGYVEFSGGLNPSIPKARFALTDEKRMGPVWFFSQNQVEAHNGYHTQASFKVWKIA